MRHYLVVFSLLIFISSCVPPQSFSIEPVGDKFSDPSAPKGFIGKRNKLSRKSSQGGTHIDNKGVYINPYVFRKDDFETIGFSVTHTNFDYVDLFRPIQSIVFLNEKQDRVEVDCKLLDVDIDLGHYNPLTNDLIGVSSEYVDCVCSKENFTTLINSTSLEVKINGGERSMIYETKDVLPTFIPNLKTFYHQKIK